MKTSFCILGITASTVAAVGLLYGIVTGSTSNVEFAIGLGGGMTWLCGFQCRHLFT